MSRRAVASAEEREYQQKSVQHQQKSGSMSRRAVASAEEREYQQKSVQHQQKSGSMSRRAVASAEERAASAVKINSCPRKSRCNCYFLKHPFIQ
ncbi:hypothetical protein [Lentibacillus kapialis]|uniref:hypothetical protein n=1 Tax=Lentibacillus kapialis TaxID=340214 RepID=UPI0016665BA1|nr:hypothetical protein [Lentibacillus kapialis]